MTLDWHLLFKVIVRIYQKMLEFCGKSSKFLTKSCLLIFCIFFNWGGVNPSITSEEIYRKSTFTLPHKKTKNKRSKTIIQFHNHHFENFCKIVTNCSWFLLFYHFCSDLDQIFNSKNWCNNFIPVIVISNNAYFIASLKVLNVW